MEQFLRLTRMPPTSPEPPANPARALQQGVGVVMGKAFSRIEGANLAIANSTAAIAQALPSFPAATLGSIAIGIPHAHLHPPSWIPPAPPVPLPVIGPVMLGTCIQVLINGMPAARVGDIGFNPTCGGLFPQFEIFTGSSKVFIGGMRAARVTDVTMHCWPPKEWLARGAIAALVAAAKVAMMGVMAAGLAAQIAGIVADGIEAAEASDEAMMAAHSQSMAMASAQMAADAIAMAVGALMGKDPCVGSPIGAILLPPVRNVLIGGFPMPSGMQIAGRILGSARGRRRRGRQGRSGVT